MPDREDASVQESRRLLRHLLSRRDFVAAAGVGALGLAGCGGGNSTTGGNNPPPPPPNGGGIPDGAQVVHGTVTLPAGSQLTLGTMSVDILTQTAPVTSAGGFTVGIPPGGPSLGLLLDAGGNGVLMAIFDPATSNPTITARTSAVALIYYAISAYLFPGSSQSQILSLVNGDPAIAALESVVATAVAADPHALANNASTLGPAITQALTTMLGSGSVRSPDGPRPAVAASAATSPTLMLLTPTGAQNGVGVDQDATTTSLLISNTKRRSCDVYIYQTSTLAGTGGNPPARNISPPVRVAGPIELDSTQSLNFFTALSDFTTFFHGKSPWSPVNLPPYPLALATGAENTTYEVVVLAGAAATLANADVLEPSFYHEPYWASEVQGWRSRNVALLGVVAFGDLLFPSFCFLLGLGPVVISKLAMRAVVADAAVAYKTTYNAVLSQLRYGSLGELRTSLIDVFETAVTSDLSRQFWKNECQAIVAQVEAKALAAQDAALVGTRLSRASAMFVKIFGSLLAVDVVLSGFDLGAVILDFYQSEMGAIWEADLTLQKLTLHPASPRVPGGARVIFTVSPPANLPNGMFQYDWSSSSLFAVFSAEGEVNVGKTITTTKLTVDLQTTGSDADPINVLVVGYDVSSGQRVEIGRAGTTVTILQRASITPSSPAMGTGDQTTFVVTVEGTLPSGVQYRWTLTGNTGSIGGTGGVVTTAVPQINYTAGPVGAAVLHVDVVDVNGLLLAQADDAITVAAAASVQLDVAGTWNLIPDVTQEPPNGHYAYTDFRSVRALQAAPGLDVIYWEYDIVNGDAVGVFFSIVLPAGQAVTSGQTFATILHGQQPTAGHFRLVLDPDQANPSDTVYAPDATYGTLRIDTLGQLIDGTYVANYSFNVGNDAGGTIIGSGTARWKDDGSPVSS